MKVVGPMFSLDASGSIGGVITASKWKGRNYFRGLVKPANPKSGLQVSVRAMFKFLSQAWNALSTADKATWEDLANAAVISTFNAYMKENQRRHRNNLTPSADYPITEATYANTYTTWSATGGTRQITLDIEQTDASGDAWGAIIYRALATGFTPALDNVIAVVLAEDATAVQYVDTPLTPDTYYYDIRGFRDDGGVANALGGEINATAS